MMLSSMLVFCGHVGKSHTLKTTEGKKNGMSIISLGKVFGNFFLYEEIKHVVCMNDRTIHRNLTLGIRKLGSIIIL